MINNLGIRSSMRLRCALHHKMCDILLCKQDTSVYNTQGNGCFKVFNEISHCTLISKFIDCKILS